MGMITFGKHRGSDWEDVLNCDEQYFEWALRALDVSRFDGPDDEELDLFLHDTNNPVMANKLVEDYRARVAAASKTTKTYHPSSYTPPPQWGQYDVNHIAVTEACHARMLEVFGCFPMNKWSNYGTRQS